MSLAGRVAGLLTHPSREWPLIAREPADIGDLYRRHVIPLAAVPAASVLMGLALAGGRHLGSVAIVTAVTAALASYAIALAVPYAASVVLEHLSPRFKSDGSTADVFKLIAYASTPIWLAGVFYLSFELSRLVVIGFGYAVYLFFAGTTPVLGMPVDQRVPFTLIAAIVVLVLHILLGWAASAARIPHFGL